MGQFIREREPANSIAYKEYLKSPPGESEIPIRRGIQEGIANAILIKPNQIGTLSETLDAIAMARGAGYGVIVSHRSGETRIHLLLTWRWARAADKSRLAPFADRSGLPNTIDF